MDEDAEKSAAKLSTGGWVILISLIVLMLAASAYAIHIWTSMDTAMSGLGWGFLIAGVIVSVVLGAGLMALLFYSAKHDYDR